MVCINKSKHHNFHKILTLKIKNGVQIIDLGSENNENTVFIINLNSNKIEYKNLNN